MDTELWKDFAARRAAGMVRDGMIVGLGSGSTVARVIRAISELRPKATFVVSSSQSQTLAASLGLKLSSLEVHDKLDMMIDGADEVDKNFDMIKGLGGAHTREKIVAGAARKVVITVDRTKLVRRLGERTPVPVELLPFAPKYTMRRLSLLGGKSSLRRGPGGAPFITDNGNYIADVKFQSIKHPAKLERMINLTPGVIENGVFSGVADVVLVGYEGGCRALRTSGDMLKFFKGMHRS